jgi:DNA-binding transcriptional LysR family regulator
MRSSSLRVRHLTVFLAVARAGTMKRAARGLHLSQPAVSKLIAELEWIFGAAMFERSKTGVTLTECGQALARRADTVLNDLENAGIEIESIARGQVGCVRVGVLPVAEARIMPAALLALREQAPRLTIRIREGTRPFLISALRQGEIDCVVGRLSDRADERDLNSEKLMQMPIKIVAAVSHPLTRVRHLSWSDLARYSWILPEQDAPIRAVIDQHFSENGVVPPTPVIESTSLRLNYAILSITEMIAVMPQDAAIDYEKTGQLGGLRVKIGDRLPAVGVITRRSSTPLAVEAFLQILRGQFQ